jgi:hypothetical protein
MPSRFFVSAKTVVRRLSLSGGMDILYIDQNIQGSARSKEKVTCQALNLLSFAV